MVENTKLFSLGSAVPETKVIPLFKSPEDYKLQMNATVEKWLLTDYKENRNSYPRMNVDLGNGQFLQIDIKTGSNDNGKRVNTFASARVVVAEMLDIDQKITFPAESVFNPLIAQALVDDIKKSGVKKDDQLRVLKSANDKGLKQ
ncbi:MAG: hypothetical protein UW75_C0047G0003 [Parcubacteria group bacterium GW2011_GWF2_44_8]|nr:MAG: hypothetical protein UW75_C0047G0003 [Parcubacteria group bacterium GW2011_GWF2_44_8]